MLGYKSLELYRLDNWIGLNKCTQLQSIHVLTGSPVIWTTNHLEDKQVATNQPGDSHTHTHTHTHSISSAPITGRPWVHYK